MKTLYNIWDILSSLVGPLVVAVHSGVFHADDVFSVAALQLLFPGLIVVRTRDKRELEKADLRVDVGGAYDTEAATFDHHFKGGPVRPDGITKYSGFGLMWIHFGELILEEVKIPKGFIGKVWEKVDQALVQGIDAGDNGQGRAPTPGEAPSILSIISGFNPPWDHPLPNFNGAFNAAVEVARGVLINTIESARAAVMAEAKVTAAVASALGCGQRWISLAGGMPWQEALLASDTEGRILFVIFQNPEGTWMVQGVPPELGAFGQRKPLPREWWGLRDEAFAAVAVEDGVFCHPNGFICGAKTAEGAIALAEKAIAA